MADLVQVIVAPNCHVVMMPHASGLAGLGALTLNGGDIAHVTRERAGELFRAGLVLHPDTNELPPVPIAVETGVTIKYSGRPRASASNPIQEFPDWRDTVEYPDPPPIPPNPWADRTPPTVTHFPDLLGLGPIVDANGRPWPPSDL